MILKLLMNLIDFLWVFSESLASNMEQFDNYELSYKTYLQTLHAQNCKFQLIDENATIKAIHHIENKSSSGHDGISNVLLKYVKLEISKPLTLIINQMIRDIS